ncbi:MAG: ribonuclease P protein component [Psychroserpens sp.]
MENEASESFQRKSRLTTAADFRHVFSKNLRLSDSGITILIGAHTGEKPRIGFAIAKKQIKKAVHRNGLKRIFRESFRRNQHRLPARDIVVMVRKQILLSDSMQLKASLDKHWNNIINRCS